MKKPSAFASLVALLWASAAAAAQLLPHGDPGQGRALAQHVCAACHGVDGNSVDPQYPKLAGQYGRYLYDQLLAFKAQGHRRASGVMGAIAVDLSDAQMRDAATYYAAQIPRGTGAPHVPLTDRLLARGESIYRQGIGRDRAVPACASCHALSGNGLAPEFPRLAGQHARYVVKQLDEFRSERRNSNPNQMMSEVAHKLTDRDIRAVAGYIATMQ
jgi:cytochrome c553